MQALQEAQAGWAAAEALLLEPAYCLEVGALFRPLLMRLVDSRVQQLKLEERDGEGPAHGGEIRLGRRVGLVERERRAVALTKLLELSPQLIG